MECLSFFFKLSVIVQIEVLLKFQYLERMCDLKCQIRS